jgi:GH24 family phage-related lysozyme (muramidase)
MENTLMKNEKEVLYGEDAVKRVEEMEGRELSYPERVVVMEEGFVNKPYEDEKGVVTYGVGQTGDWIDQPFSAAFAAHEEDARNMIEDYDYYSDDIKAALMSAAYRGDLQQSPKFRKLFNAGDFQAAADEFLNNKDYKQAKKKGSGVAARMERVADTIRNYQDMMSEKDLAGDTDKLFTSSI